MKPLYRWRLQKGFILAICMTMVLSALLLVIRPSQTAHAADDFDNMRQKWVDVLTGGVNLDTSDPDIMNMVEEINDQAAAYWQDMDKSAARTSIWGDLTNFQSDGYDLRHTYQRLSIMTLAYATTGSDLEGDITLLSDIISALDWCYANQYNSTKHSHNPYTGNWWEWSIGIPRHLGDMMILLYPDLTSAQIANWTAAMNYFMNKEASLDVVTAVNGNGIDWLVWNTLAAIVKKDGAKLNKISSKFGGFFAYSTTGVGFYKDGSYLDHTNVAYTGSYGSIMLDGPASLLWLFEGTAYDTTDPKEANTWEKIYNSFEPIIYKGLTMDMTRGRAISRSALQDDVSGAQNIAQIARAARVAPPADAARIESMVKYWVQQSASLYNIYDYLQNYDQIQTVKAIMADTGIIPRGEKIGHYEFAVMDRTVHLAPGFGFGISRSSNRVANFEVINGENRRGYHTGDGMTYLYNDDLGQFSGNFWATVDPDYLPGTTVQTIARTKGSTQIGDGEGAPANTWSGGVTLGDYGVSGMDLKPTKGSLNAKKSWFMFDDEVVNLGAGIKVGATDTSNKPVKTVAENRKLSSAGDNAFIVDGNAKLTTVGSSENMTGITWAHLKGSPSASDTSSDIGYYFPGGATVQGQRLLRTGSWHDINDGGSTSAVSNHFLTLTIDHGTKPTNGSYSYVLLPGKSPEGVSDYADNPDITVIENSSSAQTVKENGLNVTGANFWADAAYTSGGITVNKKASVMMREVPGSSIELAISDPTFKNTGTIQVELDQAATGILSADAGVTVTQLSPTIKLTVNVNNAKGKAFKVKLNTAPVEPEPEQPATDTLHPLDDAHVRGGTYGSLNYGNESFLFVKDGTDSYDRHAYLKFDLSGVGPVLSAKLRVYGGNIQDSTAVDVQAYGVDSDSWSESSITWNTAPAHTGSALSTVTVNDTIQYYEFDVTDFVQSQLASDKTATLELEAVGEDRTISFSSKEDAANLPELVIEQAPAALQPTADAHTRGGTYSGDNYGSETLLIVKDGTDSYDRRSYLKFDLSAVNAVHNAKLRVYGGNTQDATAIIVQAYGVVDDSWSETGITWSNAPAHTGAALNAVTVDDTIQYYEFDVTDFVQSQLATDQAVTLMLQAVGGDRTISWNSRENVASKPELVIQ